MRPHARMHTHTSARAHSCARTHANTHTPNDLLLGSRDSVVGKATKSMFPKLYPARREWLFSDKINPTPCLRAKFNSSYNKTRSTSYCKRNPLHHEDSLSNTAIQYLLLHQSTVQHVIHKRSNKHRAKLQSHTNSLLQGTISHGD
jgi:hypothetical protein